MYFQSEWKRVWIWFYSVFKKDKSGFSRTRVNPILLIFLSVKFCLLIVCCIYWNAFSIFFNFITVTNNMTPHLLLLELNATNQSNFSFWTTVQEVTVTPIRFQLLEHRKWQWHQSDFSFWNTGNDGDTNQISAFGTQEMTVTPIRFQL